MDTKKPDEYPKMLAKLSCGLFGISDDFIEKYQSLDGHFIKNKFSTFFLKRPVIPWSLLSTRAKS